MVLKIDELIEMQSLQKLMDSFTSIASIGCVLIDVDGRVLIHSGHPKVCNDLQRSEKGEGCTYHASSIEMNGERVAELIISQFAHAIPEQIQGIKTYLKEMIEALGRSCQMHQEQSKAKEMAEQYLDVADVVILALDNQGTIQFLNQKGCKLFGYEKGDTHTV